MNSVWNNLRMFLWLTILTGIIYPLVITGIAQLTMKKKADGGIIYSQGKPIGAALISQKFVGEKYFWPRPSSQDYNPLPSGGSNLGPTSAALKKAVEERKAAILKASGTGTTNAAKIPSELLFASGSGLDPHISPAAAEFQIDRIIKARNMDPKNGKEALKKLIKYMTEDRQFGILGEPRINVLMLNMALDRMGLSKGQT